MSTLEAALRQIAETLDRLHRTWALVGGLAVSARAQPRTTRDVDLAVLVQDDQDGEQLVANLTAAGYVIVTLVEQKAVRRLATVRLKSGRGAGAVIVELLFASCGIEREIAENAERVEIVPSLTLPLARASHLIAMKVLARDDRNRPQDWDDIRALVSEVSAVELDEVRAALSLISARGFDRGRDLLGSFESILGELRAQRCGRP